MMKIDSVASRPDRVGRHAVRFADGTAMKLYRQTIEDFSLYTGAELDDEQMTKLRDSASAMSAKMRAVRIVASANVSKGDLEKRLIHKGEDPDKAKDAVKWMADMDILDDHRTAQQIVQRCISKGYGISRAKQALYEKRIPKEYWEAALAQYPCQNEHIRNFLVSRLDADSDQKEIRRAVDALLRRGHTYSQIRRELELLNVPSEDEKEE